MCAPAKRNLNKYQMNIYITKTVSLGMCGGDMYRSKVLYS
jgi:hypothetical protein